MPRKKKVTQDEENDIQEVKSRKVTKSDKAKDNKDDKKDDKESSGEESNTEVQESAPKVENFVAPFTILYVGKHYFKGQKISEEVWGKFNKR